MGQRLGTTDSSGILRCIVIHHHLVAFVISPSYSQSHLWRALLRTEVIAICLVVFCADVVTGMIVATFSRFATNLGASVALVGGLTGFMALVSIGAALPIGLLSDRVGRRRVIAGGMVCFALSSLLYTVAPNPYWLFPVRILAALAMIAVFMMGMAYLGDIVTESERGLAVGLYATSMGMGFTVGPALGGFLAERYDYAVAYRVAALLALVGFLMAVRGLAKPAHRTAATQPPPLATQLRLLLRNPNLLAASSGALVNSLAFGVLFAFFPLYAAANGYTDAAIGTLLAGRALASTLIRIPIGLLATRLPNWLLLCFALLLMALVHLTIAWALVIPFWPLWLMVEGIAYGMFLVSGQSFVTKHTTAADRGAAIGIYGMAGSIGGALGPFTLGLVAAQWGLAPVFSLTGVVVLSGMIAVWLLRAPAAKIPA